MIHVFLRTIQIRHASFGTSFLVRLIVVSRLRLDVHTNTFVTNLYQLNYREDVPVLRQLFIINNYAP